MSDINLVSTQEHTLVVPAFGRSPQLQFDMSKIRTGEERLLEAKNVNPATYADLESCFGERYRDLRRHLTTIGHQLNLADKALRQAKAEVLLDKYPLFLEEKAIKKTQDNGDLRDAFMMRDPEYLAAIDRINMLKALESNFDGKVKVIENVSRYMKKAIDLVLRSGLSGQNLYVTSGRK